MPSNPYSEFLSTSPNRKNRQDRNFSTTYYSDQETSDNNSFVVSKRPAGSLILTKAAYDYKMNKQERLRIFHEQSAKNRRDLS